MQTKVFFKTFVLSALCFSSVSFIACDNDNDGDESGKLKFSQSQAEMEKGKTVQVLVKNGTAPFTAKSGNDTVLTTKVSNDTITLTGIAVGAVSVTVTDKNNLKGAIVARVTEATADIELDKKEVSMEQGKEETVSILKGTAPYTVSVKDNKVVTATEKDGKITLKGIKAGSTTVLITDKNRKVGTITVTVK